MTLVAAAKALQLPPTALEAEAPQVTQVMLMERVKLTYSYCIRMFHPKKRAHLMEIGEDC
jgi:hypothetical protein